MCLMVSYVRKQFYSDPKHFLFFCFLFLFIFFVLLLFFCELTRFYMVDCKLVQVYELKHIFDKLEWCWRLGFPLGDKLWLYVLGSLFEKLTNLMRKIWVNTPKVRFKLTLREVMSLIYSCHSYH